MKRCLLMMCFAALAASTALAQEKKTVPPPPTPEDNGPTLNVTMKFIEDKLNDIGPVNYILYIHDNVTGDDWSNQFRHEVTWVVADTKACGINLHLLEQRDGTTLQALNVHFLLKDVEKIVVMPAEQRAKELATTNGHPSWSFKADPSVFLLEVLRTDKDRTDFDIFDEQLANRLAKAIVHAVELCGGSGSKSEPF